MQLLNEFDPILIQFDAVYAADASNTSGKKYRCIASDICFSKSITYHISTQKVNVKRGKRGQVLLSYA